MCDVCGVHEKSLECCRSTVCEASAQPREAVALILALGRSGSSIERRVWAGGGSCACCCARACGRQNHRDPHPTYERPATLDKRCVTRLAQCCHTATRECAALGLDAFTESAVAQGSRVHYFIRDLHHPLRRPQGACTTHRSRVPPIAITSLGVCTTQGLGFRRCGTPMDLHMGLRVTARARVWSSGHAPGLARDLCGASVCTSSWRSETLREQNFIFVTNRGTHERW